jgi:RNA polymerase sigma factor (sigma-70 family)
LRRFAEDGDEVAFAELVRRYGRLVWAVCRQLVPSDADAEDAFQATFLALVRSAGSVKDGAKLGPWLHGVAVRVCSNARRAASRRKRREESVRANGHGRAVPDSAWDSALATVHEEVARLPETLRVPFVLCCLEGKGATEAAGQLGWKLGTLSGRLTRAKQTLLSRLEARGLTAATVAAIAVAGGVASAGVPAAVLDRAAVLVQTGFTVPSSILYLSQGVVGMSLSRTKLLAAAVILTGGLASVVGTGYLAEASAQQPKPKSADAAAQQVEEANRQLLLARKALAALQQQADQAEDEKKKLTSELLAQAAEKKAKVASSSKWEYDFVLASEMGTTKFVAFLNDREGRGWEFVGEVTLQHQGKDAPHWLFRRPAGGAKTATSSADDYKRAVEGLMKRNAQQADLEKLRSLEALRAAGQKKAEQNKLLDPNAKGPPADLFDKLDALKKDEAKLRLAEEAARADAAKRKKELDFADEKEKLLEREIARLKMEIEKLKVENVYRLKDLADKPKPDADNAKRVAEDIKRLIEKQKQTDKAKPSPEKVKPSPDKTKPLGEKVPDGRVEKKQVVKLAGSKLFSPEEIVELLQTSAKKQFGKDAPIIELDPKSGGVVVAGSAKAVEWVVALAEKLNRDEVD